MLNVAQVLQLPLSIRIERTPLAKQPRRPRPNPNHRHFCGEAVVAAAIAPQRPGRVRYRAGWWPAQCDANVAIAPGEVVQVVGVRGIALLVQPLAIGS